MTIITRKDLFMINIFVVEDDKNIREIEEYALKNTGYKVEGFKNA